MRKVLTVTVALLMSCSTANVVTTASTTDAGLSASPTSTLTPSAAPTPSLSEVAAPLPQGVVVDSGTYFMANPYTDDDPVRDCDLGCASYARIVFTMPEGWRASDGIVHKHLGEPDEMTFSIWVVDLVYADPCRWQNSPLGPIDEIHPEVHDAPGNSFVRRSGGLANQAHRGPLPRELNGVILGGVFAVRIDLSVPSELDISTCDDGEFRSWTEWDVADGANSHHASAQFDTIYIVDVDRRPLVIDVSHMPGTSDQDLAELDAILESMTIE